MYTKLIPCSVNKMIKWWVAEFFLPPTIGIIYKNQKYMHNIIRDVSIGLAEATLLYHQRMQKPTIVMTWVYVPPT